MALPREHHRQVLLAGERDGNLVGRRALEPHRMTDYLEGLARRFHLWYHDDRILVEDSELAKARLALARATRHVLREGLALLGISAPDNM